MVEVQFIRRAKQFLKKKKLFSVFTTPCTRSYVAVTSLFTSFSLRPDVVPGVPDSSPASCDICLSKNVSNRCVYLARVSSSHYVFQNALDGSSSSIKLEILVARIFPPPLLLSSPVLCRKDLIQFLSALRTFWFSWMSRGFGNK